MKNTGSSSVTMAVARIVVGIMFLFFAQYKLLGREFAHGGYEKYVTGYVQESAVSVYKPFLRATLKYPVASAYAVAVAELLIGLSMVLGFWVRPFAHCGCALHVQPSAFHVGPAAGRARMALLWQ